MAEHHSGNRGGNSFEGRGNDRPQRDGGNGFGGAPRGERPPTNDRRPAGDRPAYGGPRRDDRGAGNRSFGGERKPSTDRGDRPSFGGGDRRPSGGRPSGDRPFNDRGDRASSGGGGGERREWQPREGGAPRGDRPSFGGGDRRPSGGRPSGDRPSYGDRAPREGGERREWQPREGGAPRGDRPSFGGGAPRGDRPSFGGGQRNDRPSFGGGDRRPSGDRPFNDRAPREGGERREWQPREGGAPRNDRPSFGGGDRRPSGDRPSYGDRAPRNDRPAFGGGDRRPAGGRPSGDRPSYGDRAPREGGERREWQPREGGAPRGDRPSFGGGDRRPSGDRPSYGDRAPRNDRPSFGGGERKPFNDRNDRPSFGGGERKPFNDRNDRPSFGGGDRRPSGDRPSYGDRAPREGGERREWQPREGGAPRGDRPSFGGGDRRPSGDRPSFSGGDRRPAGGRPAGDRPSFGGGARRDDRGAGDRSFGGERKSFNDRGPREDRPAPVRNAKDLRSANRPDRERSPEIDEDVTGAELDKVTRAQLRTLEEKNAEWVSRHLVMAGRLMDVDAELAFQHALAASRRGGRMAAVREAVGLTAYAAGHYGEALREFRTFRRISGSNEHLPVMADCERGLGRPDRALDLLRSEEAETLDAAGKVEAAIVASGARTDLGELDAAVAALEIPQLDLNRAFSYSPRLFRAYAAALAAVGRNDESATYERQAVVAEDALGLGEDADPFIFDLGEEDEPERKPRKPLHDPRFDENGEAIVVKEEPEAEKKAPARKVELDEVELDDAESDYFESDDAESDEDSAEADGAEDNDGGDESVDAAEASENEEGSTLND
ncbi:hypothetical protein [Arthrobacter sp. 35W]|uniref:hypothetical protein n=1 Tax=Arthrobacter sp. 35W TaxID=1132441 RepID=UPI001E309AA1|nr:hypothetical protein [Arthrobacter sp. 35W]